MGLIQSNQCLKIKETEVLPRLGHSACSLPLNLSCTVGSSLELQPADLSCTFQTGQLTQLHAVFLWIYLDLCLYLVFTSRPESLSPLTVLLGSYPILLLLSKYLVHVSVIPLCYCNCWHVCLFPQTDLRVSCKLGLDPPSLCSSGTQSACQLRICQYLSTG